MVIGKLTRFLKGIVDDGNPSPEKAEIEPCSEQSNKTVIKSELRDDNSKQTDPLASSNAEIHGCAINEASSTQATDFSRRNEAAQAPTQDTEGSNSLSNSNGDDCDLRASPLDISLTDFIISQVASTRLMNCSRADYLATTTIRTALSNRDAFERECLKLSNFGKGTLDELNSLLDTAFAALKSVNHVEMEAPKDTAAFHIICELFDCISLRELCAVRSISVRLTNGLAGFSKYDNFLGKLFLNWPSVRQNLSQQKNMGAKSIDELENLCQEFVAQCLSVNGIPDNESRKIAHLILRQERLPKELADIAITALSGAAPVSADVLVEDDIQHPEVFSERLLAFLDERSRDVVRRRFGFTDTGVETLEQIAQTYGVTRERIRQLEFKALRKLQKVGKSLPLRAALLEYGRDLWSTLAGPKGFIKQIDTASSCKIPANFKLLLNVSEWQLENWLDVHSRKWGAGWVPYDIDIEALDTISWQINNAIKGKPLPRPIPGDIIKLDAQALETAIALQLELQREGYYILPQGAGQRTARRAATLHSSFKTAMVPHTSDKLATALSETSKKEGVSSRYAAMLATRYPHLFIEADDDEWFAVGTPAALVPSATEIEAPVENSTEAAGTSGFTMASFLTEILVRTGPMRLNDLQAEAIKTLPSDRSPASIGPSLLLYKDTFDRVLPGVYALRGAVPLGHDLLESRPSYLLNSEQARLFAMGRRAGEPWGAYKLWTCEAEYALCCWARQNADPALLDSLLTEASFDLWPVDDLTRAEWKTFANQERRAYQLHFQPRAEVGYALPKADRLLAACLEARHAGHFDWMVGNRILNKVADSPASAGLIVLMITLGALRIDPTGNWQMPHECGPKLQELTEALSVELHNYGDLCWSSEIGRKLLGDVDVVSAATENWIDSHLLNAMLSSVPVEDDDDAEIDIDELNRLIAAEAGSIGWETDDVATSPQNVRDAAIVNNYRAIEVASTRVVHDQDGEWSLDDITDHSGN